MEFEGLNHLAPFLIWLVALMIPIVAIVAGPIFRARREQQLHETLRQLSERGQPIPPELFNGKLGMVPKPESGGSTRSQLRDGALSIGAGLGLMVMFWVMQPDRWLWAIGCLPLFVGVAMLLVWRFESKQARP